MDLILVLINSVGMGSIVLFEIHIQSKKEPSTHASMNRYICVCNFHAERVAWQIGPPSPQSLPDAVLILPECPGMAEKDMAEKEKMRC